jgi:3-methyladenine DNA glycosylase/8-oxoguanine DNA glycosylase
MWWNLLALCQRCHLTIQSRVNPDQPYMLEHSDWFKPYVAAFYAWKYEGRDITREQSVAEMERLLTLERIA